MIAKISSGQSTGKLITYLYDIHKAKDHTDPHLVASWDGFAPDPGRSTDPRAAKRQLVQALDLRVKQAGDRVPAQHLWHCSIRAAPTDRTLSDEEWADIARRVVAATGIAPEGDPDGCRWIAVRHADDHIHIAATKVRGDLRPARHWNDYLTADRELAAIETEYGLHQVVRGDRTATKRPTRAETEKAHRTGRQHTSRETLRTAIRTAVSLAASPQEFITLLTSTEGILVEIQHFPSGDVRGYKIALVGDTNAAGEPIWFSGSTLAPDLSFPKITERLTATEPRPANPGSQQNRRRPDPWYQATAAAERIPNILDQGNDSAAQAHLAAFGEALDALPLLAPKDIRPQLRRAAVAFERAARSRIKADHQHARALRGAVRAMSRQPATGDGAALAMFLDIAVLAVMAFARWHEMHHHDQQIVAARQTLHHLQAAYDQAAAAPLAAMAQRKPSARQMKQFGDQVRQAVPDYAAQILSDPAWDALAAALAEAQAAGHEPTELLQQAASQRTLDDARSPAEVLTLRVYRLARRSAPGERARAAQARSTLSAPAARPSPIEPVSEHQPGPAAGQGLRR